MQSSRRFVFLPFLPGEREKTAISFGKVALRGNPEHRNEEKTIALILMRSIDVFCFLARRYRQGFLSLLFSSKP